MTLEIRSHRGGVVTVKEAIEGSLGERDHGQGQLEGVVDGVNALQRMMGSLVEKLHAHGHLSDADVVDMLGWRYTARDEKS